MKIHGTMDGLNGFFLDALDADFQLHQSFSESRKQLQFFLRQQVRRYFKMKVRLSPVIGFNKPPNRHCMGMAAVEGPVYKFDLRHFPFNKKQQLLFHQLYAAQADSLFDG